MNNRILEIAKVLEANKAPNTFDENVEIIKNEYTALQNVAENRGYEKNIINAVFDYLLNHHMFELDSIEKTKTILTTITELACPLAADDARSTKLLNHLQKHIQKRINEL